MSNPKSEESRQSYIDKNPFDGLKIDDNSILDLLEGRHPCPKCGKSRKFYCYSCYVPIKELEGKLPVVKLPIKIDIIKHKHEIDGKSTAGHAAILAKDYVNIYTYPDIPDYENENVVLIFPSQKAISVSQLVTHGLDQDIIHKFQNAPLDELPPGFNRSTLMKKIPKSREEYEFGGNFGHLPITRAIFIDSTWNQSKSIYKDERIKSIPCVVIQNRISQFWRHQKGSPRWYLATVEAIHQFLIEIHLHMWGLNRNYAGIYNCFTEKCLDQFKLLYNDKENAYNGQYDNLLYFFQHMYKLIHSYYSHEELYAYQRRLM
ncbi:tRNA-uridine aminocarboxypropyltransferase 1 [Diorhabda carinulata]|uniref:tRNA-uridine aminocarboxypropyltransferase 1 n=1 Tax=Diorhabda carinulata TaxID=1163345 RepID=UPI0025A2C050|nr:tRNA-uridine aminocarboxypropyltransferase 1 [Diorhabda carinulata]